MIYFVSIIALLSVAINVALFWYIRKLLSYTQEMLGDFIDLSEEVLTFGEHLDSVYKMDRFYGDTTLEQMLEHTKELNVFLKEFVTQKKDLFEEEQNDNEKSTIKKEEAQ